MLDAIKVLFVLTGASTYLVTKNLPTSSLLPPNRTRATLWPGGSDGRDEANLLWNNMTGTWAHLSHASHADHVIPEQSDTDSRHRSLSFSSHAAAAANDSNWQQASAALLMNSYNSSGPAIRPGSPQSTASPSQRTVPLSPSLPFDSWRSSLAAPRLFPTVGKSDAERHRFQLSALSQSEGSGNVSSSAATGRGTDSAGSATAAGRSPSAAVNDLAINFTVTSNASLSSSSVEAASTAHRPSALSSLPSAARPSLRPSPPSSSSADPGGSRLLEHSRTPERVQNEQQIPSKTNKPNPMSINKPTRYAGSGKSVAPPSLAVDASQPRAQWSSPLPSSPAQPYYYLPVAEDYYYYESTRSDAKQPRTPLNALMTSTGESSATSTSPTNELSNSTSAAAAASTATSRYRAEVKQSLSAVVNSATISSNDVLRLGQDDEDEGAEENAEEEEQEDDEEATAESDTADDYEHSRGWPGQRIDHRIAERRTVARPSSHNLPHSNELDNEKTQPSEAPIELPTSEGDTRNEKSNQETGTGRRVAASVRPRRNRFRPKSKKSVATKGTAAVNTASAIQQPVYEVLINEEDKDLPKKLFQVKALMINDPKKSSTSSKGSPPGSSSGLMFILSGNGVDYEHPEQSKFAINAFTGELFLIAPVDRDPPNGRDVWRLNITAEDERGEKVNGSVLVLVRVRDINDNAPYFEKEVFHANVSENMGSGIDVIRLNAIDKDVDSIVRYSIEMNRVNSEGELIFDIDELSGVVSTAVCCLDRESIDQFTIKVCATDEAISGDASFHWSSGKSVAKASGKVSSTKSPMLLANQTSCTSVMIDITDENDEPPRFVRDKYFLQLPDGVNELFPGRVLLNTTVTDGDLPETNRFACRLSGAIRFPSLLSKAAEATASRNSSDDNDTSSVASPSLPSTGIFTQPMSILRKYFQCEVNATNGNVRLLISESPSTYEPEKFYRSLISEFETYRQSSATISTLPEIVEFQFKLAVTDVGAFESLSDDMPVEQHITNADLSVKFATVKPINGMRSEGANDTGGMQPSLVVVTKQISPNSYNSEHGGSAGGAASTDLFAHLRSKWHLVHDRTGPFVLIGGAVLLLLGCAFAMLLLSRHRRAANKRRHRSGLASGTMADSIPGAICCMAVTGVAGSGGHGGSASLPITSDESNGTNSDHLLGCSSYGSAMEGEVHHEQHGHHQQTSLGGHGKMYGQYGQLAEQLSSTPESLFCHSANSNSTSARTNTGSSIISDNYLLDPYRAKSPSTMDGSTDTSGAHLVLLDPNDHHLSQHHHHLGNQTSNQYSEQLTTYGFEINAPYDTIALYDLTHLQTIPLSSGADQAGSSSGKRKSMEMEMSQLRSSNADLGAMGQVPTSLAILGIDHASHSSTAELGVVLSPNSVAGTPIPNSVLPDVISKVQQQQQQQNQALCDSDCATTGNFLLIGAGHHHLLSSPNHNHGGQS